MPVDIMCGVCGAELTTIGVGGQIRTLYLPQSVSELADIWCRLHLEGCHPFVLGAGSNLLVDDGEVERPVVSTRKLNRLSFEDGAVVAEAGVGLQKLIRICAERGLAGLEGLVGIPASVGGAVAMNAGGGWGTVAEVVERVEFVRPDGAVVTRPRGRMCFGYRRGPQKKSEVVARVWFRLKKDEPDAIWERIRTILRKKMARQPLSDRSAGCVFKNPGNLSAGYLIERVGMKGMRCGGAVVSRRHANFIINDGGATCGDILHLMREAIKRVHECFGIRLEPEIVRLGG